MLEENIKGAYIRNKCFSIIIRISKEQSRCKQLYHYNVECLNGEELYSIYDKNNKHVHGDIIKASFNIIDLIEERRLCKWL